MADFLIPDRNRVGDDLELLKDKDLAPALDNNKSII